MEIVNTKEGWIIKKDNSICFTNNAFNTASTWQEQFLDDQGNSVTITKIRITQDRKGVYAIGEGGKLFRY
jgi:hypothetical protein